jgi:hypothetical protein
MPRLAPAPIRLLAVAALAALALASPWLDQARADAAQVSVVSPGGAEQTLSLDALAGSEDVVDRSYLLRSSGGDSSLTISGFSLSRILDAAGADPYGFSYLEVQRPAGGAVLLGRDQALASGADGSPAVYSDAAGTGFVRPSAGSEDLNAEDSFVAPQGISIVLRKGTHLRVRATASTKRTRPGKAVDFSAVVEQAGSGERLAYSWYFDDGGSASGAEATHSFARPGSYDVVVGVTSDGNETGASAVVTIQVGAPLAGPDRKGGGTDEDANAPDHGSATGTGTGSLGGSGGSIPPPVPSTPAPVPSEGAPPAPPAKPEPRPTAAPSGELVEGELVSAETDAPTPSAPQAAARTGKLDDGSGGGIPGAAWGILATLGLFGAGALIETRSLLG